MTELRFYEYRTRSLEEVLPDILSKAYERGMRAVVLADSEQRVQQLNTVLWTYDPDGFLPHGSEKDGFAEDQPIWLTVKENDRPNDAGLLVVTYPAEMLDLTPYTLCCFMVDGKDPETSEKARQYYKKSSIEGQNATYWLQTPQGKWEKT